MNELENEIRKIIIEYFLNNKNALQECMIISENISSCFPCKYFDNINEHKCLVRRLNKIIRKKYTAASTIDIKKIEQNILFFKFDYSLHSLVVKIKLEDLKLINNLQKL